MTVSTRRTTVAPGLMSVGIALAKIRKRLVVVKNVLPILCVEANASSFRVSK